MTVKLKSGLVLHAALRVNIAQSESVDGAYKDV